MLEIILIILALKSMWIISALLEGFFQGHYYDLIPIDKGHKNIHSVYGVMRSILLIALFWIAWYNLHIWDALIFAFTCCFSYSFFHNGMLYTTRNNLNPDIYKKRWWANKEPGSVKGSANIEIEVGFRIAMLVVAIVFIVGIILDALSY